MTTIKQAYLNHTISDLPSVKGVMWNNMCERIPAHARHRNPREFKYQHKHVQTCIDVLKSEPTLRSFERLSDAIYPRVSGKRLVAHRIAARIALKIPNTPFILARSLRTNNYTITLKSGAIMYKGRPTLKNELQYDILKAAWVYNNGRSIQTVRIISSEILSSEDGITADKNGRAHIYYAFFERYADIPNELTLDGRTYIYAMDNNDTANFIDRTFENDMRIMSNYDATYALEEINELQSRYSTHHLRGQPSLEAGAPAIGVELELDNITNDDDLVKNVTDFIRSGLAWRGSVTAVNDGSLGNYGAEFVTGWGDPELVVGVLEKTLDEHGLRTDRNCTAACGVHIHLSRTYFTNTTHIAAVQWVLERDMFRPIVEFVSHRYNTYYCKAGVHGRRYDNPQSGKYRAVNCDHTPTIEFRMFGAPKNVGDMFHYKDLVLSVVEWARGMPRLWTPRAFGKWLAMQPKYVRFFRHIEQVLCQFEGAETAELVQDALNTARLVASMPLPETTTTHLSEQMVAQIAEIVGSRTVATVNTSVPVRDLDESYIFSQVTVNEN